MTSRQPRGFTLIELAVTLLVLAAAAAVAAPSLAAGLDTLRARGEAAGIATLLRAAREQAVTRQRPTEVVVKGDEGLIEVIQGESVTARRRVAAGVRVAPEPGTPRIITFLPQGLSSGARLRVESPGRRGYLITVDPLTGRVAAARLDT